MKTEQQILKRMDDVIQELERISAGSPEDQSFTDEEKEQLLILFGMILGFGWTMDLEEEIQSLFRTLRLHHLRDSLGDKL